MANKSPLRLSGSDLDTPTPTASRSGGGGHIVPPLPPAIPASGHGFAQGALHPLTFPTPGVTIYSERSVFGTREAPCGGAPPFPFLYIYCVGPFPLRLLVFGPILLAFGAFFFFSWGLQGPTPLVPF